MQVEGSHSEALSGYKAVVILQGGFQEQEPEGIEPLLGARASHVSDSHSRPSLSRGNCEHAYSPCEKAETWLRKAGSSADVT